MDQHPADTSTGVSSDVKNIEEALRSLWDRTRRAGELIVQLRAENKSLGEKSGTLELEVSRLQRELLEKEAAVKKLTSELTGALNRGDSVFTNGERQALGARVRELLDKIEGYL